MGTLRVTFDGGVVAEPEFKEVGSNGARVLEFPVYVNRRRKNRDSGEYEDTGDVTKIRVQLWNEAADTTDVRKGDIVEVTGTLYEREYQKRDGTPGRALETDFVEQVRVVFRKDGGGDGFVPDSAKGFA